MTDKIFKVTFESQVILPEDECQEAMNLFLHGDAHLINMMLDNARPTSAKVVKIKKVRE